MKNFFYSVVVFFLYWSNVFAAGPRVQCEGLPGCSTSDTLPSGTRVIGILGRLISEGIKYLAVIAVISLMGAGIMYMVSGGNDEKVSKAKMWIIYSLVGVFLSVAAWSIINVLNEIRI